MSAARLPADYASRSPPACRPAVRRKWQLPRLRQMARYTSRAPDACTSIRNAGGSSAPLELATVTHPFHPYCGQQGECVARRGNRSGKRWLLRFADGRICSVPPQWTDAGAPDPEGIVAVGDALCSFADLLELSELVARLMLEHGVVQGSRRKGNYAATVKRKTPQSPWGLR
jgi:hypothetical protein